MIQGCPGPLLQVSELHPDQLLDGLHRSLSTTIRLAIISRPMLDDGGRPTHLRNACEKVHETGVTIASKDKPCTAEAKFTQPLHHQSQ